MNRDSELIFENYLKLRTEQFADEPHMTDVYNEDSGSLTFFVLQVLDPTGVLSYADLYRAAKNLSEGNNGVPVVEDIAVFLLATFCALPNAGFVAAGVGGIGWMGLKALVKGALKAGPKATIPLTNKMIQFVMYIPLGYGTKVVEKALLKLRSAGKLSDNAYKDVLAVFQSGKIGDFKHAENIAMGRGGQAGIAGVGPGGVSDTAKALGAASLAARSGMNMAQGDTGDVDLFKNRKNKNTKIVKHSGIKEYSISRDNNGEPFVAFGNNLQVGTKFTFPGGVYGGKSYTAGEYRLVP